MFTSSATSIAVTRFQLNATNITQLADIVIPLNNGIASYNYAVASDCIILTPSTDPVYGKTIDTFILNNDGTVRAKKSTTDSNFRSFLDRKLINGYTKYPMRFDIGSRKYIITDFDISTASNNGVVTAQIM